MPLDPTGKFETSDDGRILVAVAVLAHGGRVFMAHRSGGAWEFVGGKVDAGESVLDALYRECEEEVGLPRPLVTSQNLIMTATATGQGREYLEHYILVELSAEWTVRPEGTHDRWGFFTLDEALRLELLPPNDIVLEKVRRAVEGHEDK